MIDNKKIIHQLERILESPSFRSSKLLRSFLKYVVDQSIKGNSENIKAYNIAVDAFGREVDFDAQKDAIVRITAGKLRKELDAYYNGQGRFDSIRISIPKGNYQPEFETVKNINPKGDKSFRTFGFKRFYPWAAVLFFAIVGFGLFKFFPSAELSNGKPIILFFEIENISLESENDIWAQGITEDIVVLSSRFSELTFFGPIKTEDKLDANRFDKDDLLFALRGNFKKSDSLFILNVRLNNYRNGEVLWSKSFKRTIDSKSLIEIEYEVCNDIATNIASIYGMVNYEVIRNTSTSNPKLLSSHKSILQYYKFLKSLSYDEFLVTEKALIQTTKVDPDYAVGWSALGALYMDEYISFGGDSTKCFTKAHQYINRALEIDPNNVLVQNSWVLISYLSHQIEDFKQAITKVQNLNPTNIMIGENGLFLVYQGESKRGLDMINKARKYAINYPGYFHFGPFIDFYRKGEYENALFEVNQVKMPEHYGDPLGRAIVLVNLNRMDEAIEAKKELLKLIPDFEKEGAKILSRTLFNRKDVDAMMKDFSRIKSNK